MTAPSMQPDSAYNPELDGARLESQYWRVFNVMLDERWRCPKDIELRTGIHWVSAGSCLRSMRSIKGGGHTINRRRSGRPERGLFEYQLVLNRVPPILGTADVQDGNAAPAPEPRNETDYFDENCEVVKL